MKFRERMFGGLTLVDVYIFFSRENTNHPGIKKKIRSCIFMSIAYASNIGGTGSLIGSGPQLALKGILNE